MDKKPYIELSCIPIEVAPVQPLLVGSIIVEKSYEKSTLGDYKEVNIDFDRVFNDTW